MCAVLTVALDATTLGHAKATIDNGILSGSITRDGNFVMCVLLITDALFAHSLQQTRRSRWDPYSVH